MDKVKHYVADVLSELCTEVFTDVCKTRTDIRGNVLPSVFAGHRPSGIKGMDEFLVIRTSSNLGEHNVYQQMSLYVEIRVRNLESGLEDTLRLQELLDKVDEKFPYVSPTKRFSIKNPVLVISGDDGLEFTTWLVRSSLQINTTDRFYMIPNQ